MYRYLENQCRIEIIPLVNIGIQNLLYLVFLIVLSNLKIDVCSHLSQILTIGIVAMGFMRLYFVIENSSFQMNEKIFRIIFMSINLGVLIILALICLDVLKLHCDNYFQSFSYVIIDSVLIPFSVACITFGLKLMNIIKQVKESHKTFKYQNSPKQQGNSITEILPDEDFYVQILKQIKIVVISLFIYVAAYIVYQIVKWNLDDYECTLDQTLVHITTPGQLLLLSH